ncbi:MAG: bifunctional riboflavin kinase/FAD synthetase [Oscillibacter sp.]|nr:bifunctional riboflavin kinase/FAD synthetase [Oscillibacter sp.]
MNNTRGLALGFFDGVHLGHQALLTKARQRAAERGCPAAALTFDAHPDEVVFGQRVQLLNRPEDRDLLLRRFGMEEILLLHFDRAMAAMPWERFVEEILLGQYHACHVVCGHDFTFGHRGQGNAQRLREKCTSLGIGCDIIEAVSHGGITVSSTHLRQLIAEGDLEQVAEFLGHPHTMTGTVIRGKQLGRQLGIPTANVAMPDGVLPPAFGVYATMVRLPDGSRHMAVTNIGRRPTVEDGMGILAEPWILDYDGDLYGQTIRLEFHKFLRKEQKFASLNDLQAAILQNAKETREFFRWNADH